MKTNFLALIFVLLSLNSIAQINITPNTNFHRLAFTPTLAGAQPNSTQLNDFTDYTSAGRSAVFDLRTFNMSQAMKGVIDNKLKPILENLFSSTQVVRIRFSTGVLPANILAEAGPSAFADNFTSASGQPSAIANTLYPIALAEKLTESDINTSTQFDVEVNINTTLPNGYNWSFNTDGNVANNEIEFLTVMLHEVLHGLGFGGTARLLSPTSATWGLGANNFPMVFDRFVKDGLSPSNLLTSYTAGSTAFNDFFFGNKQGVFFDGTFAKNQNGNLPVKLHASSTIRPGSNIYHLDDNTFPNGVGTTPPNPNALMNTATTNGKAGVKQTVGNVIRGILNDIGWNIPLITNNSIQSTFCSGNPSNLNFGSSPQFCINVYSQGYNIQNESFKLEIQHSQGKLVLASSTNRNLNINNLTLPSGYDYSRDHTGKIKATLSFFGSYTSKFGGSVAYTKNATKISINALPNVASLDLLSTSCTNNSMMLGFNSVGATGYILYYGTSPSNYQFISFIPDGKFSHVLANLARNTNYYFSVRGTNSTGYGPFSPEKVFSLNCSNGSKTDTENNVTALEEINNQYIFSFIANNSINIKTSGYQNDILEINLFDLSGRLVYNNKEVVKDVEYTLSIPTSITRGLYILDIRKPNEASIHKNRLIVE